MPPHPPPPTQGFHYTSIGLWLLPSPRAPVSSLPPAAQSPRLCISTPTVPLFSPTAPFICLRLSRHLPPFPFCPSCTLPLLSQVSTLPVTLTLSPFSPSPPRSSAICHPSVSPSSDSSKLSLCSHVPTSLSRLHPPFPFLSLHFPECY